MLQTAFRDALVFLQGREWWRDLLDLAVVTFLAYRVLLLIRGTRAVQLMAGLGVLAVLGLAANALHLQLTSYIFGNLAPALLIGVVILFQPELRRALDRVGRVGFLGRPLAHYSLQLLGRLVDQVVHGTIRLSERRVGAIIVFERGVGIENYALTGVRLNAEVTAELLEAIFFPRSPLHDGAVIIRGNQVVAAGCLLPMSEEVVTAGRIGTRHRAALSLSMESDATIIVVSEETGKISLVQDGNLRKVEAESLRQILHNVLVPSDTPLVPRLLRRRRPVEAGEKPVVVAEVKGSTGPGEAEEQARPASTAPAPPSEVTP
ncbi:MAG TPA: diadenylate cyclase CdaA [Candidatus Dormibacteraeota bacterium]|jgi:diadenylate cyclase|nr:diadenylate cyclase CdaA [Candidatus Dormibacteraeota bacterium]